MRFTAEISCFESTFDTDTVDDADDDGLQLRHFESDEAEATVKIRSNRRSITMPPARSGRVSSKKSMCRISEEVWPDLFWYLQATLGRFY